MSYGARLRSAQRVIDSLRANLSMLENQLAEAETDREIERLNTRIALTKRDLEKAEIRMETVAFGE